MRARGRSTRLEEAAQQAANDETPKRLRSVEGEQHDTEKPEQEAREQPFAGGGGGRRRGPR